MKILVSACLLGTNCKYTGGNNRSDALIAFLKNHTAIPVCPEVMGGLPCPRFPAEIVDGVVTNDHGESVDREFREGAQAALQTAKEAGVDIAILQARSPSCGVHEIYDGSFSRRKVPGKGIFAQLLDEAGIPAIDTSELDAWLENSET